MKRSMMLNVSKAKYDLTPSSSRLGYQNTQGAESNAAGGNEFSNHRVFLGPAYSANVVSTENGYYSVGWEDVKSYTVNEASSLDMFRAERSSYVITASNSISWLTLPHAQYAFTCDKRFVKYGIHCWEDVSNHCLDLDKIVCMCTFKHRILVTNGEGIGISAINDSGSFALNSSVGSQFFAPNFRVGKILQMIESSDAVYVLGTAGGGVIFPDNNTFGFSMRAIDNFSGIPYREACTAKYNSNSIFAWTGSNLVEINNTSCKPILPDISSSLHQKLHTVLHTEFDNSFASPTQMRNQVEWATAEDFGTYTTPLYSVGRSSEFVKVTNLNERYLSISYGPYRFSHFVLYDKVLDRLSIIHEDHLDLCFDQKDRLHILKNGNVVCRTLIGSGVGYILYSNFISTSGKAIRWHELSIAGDFPHCPKPKIPFVAGYSKGNTFLTEFIKIHSDRLLIKYQGNLLANIVSFPIMFSGRLSEILIC